MALKGNQKKLDRNNNNRIDAQDFKMLRAGKKKGGMFKGYTKPFETAARPGSTGTSTIVGVKPNAKLRGVNKRKKFKSMDEMRKAKGFKPGETVSQFNKRRMLLASAKEAAKATRIGKIVAPIALAGVGAIQYLKSKMKNKKEEPKKKMGGGMMQRPMGYKTGGPLGSAGRGLGKAAGTQARAMGRGSEKKSKTINLMKDKIYKYKAKKDSGFTDKQVSMQKDIKEKRGHSQRPKKFPEDKHGRFRSKVFDASPTILSKAGLTGNKATGMPGHSLSLTSSKGKTTLNYAKPYGGAIETGFKGYDKRTPSVGLKKGGTVTAKCKLGRNKPTKMY